MLLRESKPKVKVVVLSSHGKAIFSTNVTDSTKMAHTSVETTVRDAMIFLKKFNWVHDVQLTKIFDGTLHKIHSEWLPILTQLNPQELNNLPFIGVSSTQMHPAWPATLHDFLNMASKLSLPRDQVEIRPASVDANMARGMNRKKLHEVSHMASLIHEVVTDACCDLIVDVGSGLGYLDHVLHQVHHHSVLGLETVDSHVSGAESRAAIQGLQCGGVKSVKFNLTNDTSCFQQFVTLLESAASSLSCRCKTTVGAAHQTVSEDLDTGAKSEIEVSQVRSSLPRVCLIGLHCCGDLSPAMLAMFHQVQSVQAVCFVSCCYHKMSYVSGEHPNFPLSYRGREFYTRIKSESPPWQIPPQTLRLGAQETRCRWREQTKEDHMDHMRHVAYRGLLELAAPQKTFFLIVAMATTPYVRRSDEIRRLSNKHVLNCCNASEKRKLVRKCDFSSFDAFLDSYFSSSYFTEADITSGKSVLKDLYAKYKDDFCLIEVFTALQTVVQPVIESLIYNDRLLWLIEQGHTKIKVVPVFNETISPRNLAVVVNK